MYAAAHFNISQSFGRTDMPLLKKKKAEVNQSLLVPFFLSGREVVGETRRGLQPRRRGRKHRSACGSGHEHNLIETSLKRTKPNWCSAALQQDWRHTIACCSAPCQS